jgi:hypothetical protein
LYDHVDVYLDESGDMGFSPSSSRHLVVAGVASAESFRFRRLVRETRRRFGSEARRWSELKFNRSSNNLRVHLLKGIADADSLIVWTGISKQGSQDKLRSSREELVHSMFAEIASEASRRLRSRHMDLVVDRRMNKEMERMEFDSVLKAAILAKHGGYFPPMVRVRHVDSFNSYGLQLADHVAGAVFRMLEFKDDSFLRLIAPRIEYGRLKS